MAVIKKFNESLRNLRRQFDELRNKINRGFLYQTLKLYKKPPQNPEILELKNSVNEMKKQIESIDNKANQIKERISDLEDRIEEIIH